MNERFLGLDTETTGFKKSGPLIQDGQARVCQIAMILKDEDGKTISQFCSLIKPEGWTISDGAMKVHGITNEMCEQFGIDSRLIFLIYKAFAEKATKIIAHNSTFDEGMMEIEGAYNGQPKILTPWHCTMKTNTHISGGRWPKLCDVVRHYCNRETTNAHDAMGDCIDCLDVFFATYRK
jgi:DNA polymerase-3 subunit epsilon